VGRGPVAKRHQEPKGIKSQKASRAKRHQEPKGISQVLSGLLTHLKLSSGSNRAARAIHSDDLS
jgi:hypothetical protein